jgi:hypothetical protein
MDFGDSHRRSIANALRYTEERLGQIEAALTDQGSLRILHHIEDDLTPLQKDRISGRIYTIRSLIASLKGALSLEVPITPLSQMIGGATSALWVTLVGTEPERLTRYGPVPEEISTGLGPALEAIIAQIRELQAIATSG